MLERIRQILSTRALSPTQFADTIGIGRPVVSHILSGRNKPSLEVIQKIVDAFPDLALPWLLKGEGPMLTSGPTAPTAPVVAISEPLAGRTRKNQRPTSRNASEPASEAVKLDNDSQPAQQVETADSASSRNAADVATTLVTVPTTPVSAPAVPPVPATPVPAATSVLPDVVTATAPEKAIRRIIIFYRDGTFSDYQPEA